MHESIARIGALLPAGHAAAVVELTEYALGRVDVAMGTLDDSSGWFSDIVTDLERLHHQACLVVRPDPVALAQRLFAFEVDGEWDIFIDSVERYADVLGDDGVAEMRRLAEARWADMPERPPGAGVDRSPPRKRTHTVGREAEPGAYPRLPGGDVDGSGQYSGPRDVVRLVLSLGLHREETGELLGDGGPVGRSGAEEHERFVVILAAPRRPRRIPVTASAPLIPHGSPSWSPRERVNCGQ